MKVKKILCFLSLLFFVSGVLIAQEDLSQETEDTQKADWSMASQWGVGVKAGLNGVGFEVIKGLGDRLNVRLGYSTFSYSYTLEQDFQGLALEATAKATLGAAGLLIDFYPVKNIIHLTAGVVQNNTLIGVSVAPTSGFPYGDIEVPPEELGGVTAEIGPELAIAPYFGLGFGNTLSRSHRVSFNFELGTIYQGSPQITLDGTNMLGPMASDHNANVLMEAVEQYKWFPVLTLQLSFRII